MLICSNTIEGPGNYHSKPGQDVWTDIVNGLCRARESANHGAAAAWARKVDNLLAVREFPSADDVAVIVDVIFSLCTAPNGNLKSQAKLTRTLVQIVSKGDKRCSKMPELEWRPIYDSIMSIHFPVRGQRLGFSGTSVLDSHGHAMVELARSGNKFFSASAQQEILDEILPQINPYDMGSQRALCLLAVFLPIRAEESPEWANKLIDMWTWFEHSPTWDLNMFYLFYRLAKATAMDCSVFDWAKHIPFLYDRFLRVLDLPTAPGGSTPYHASITRCPKECSILIKWAGSRTMKSIKLISRIAARTLAVPGGFDHFQRLVVFIEPFYHPSNESSATYGLAVLLANISKKFCQQIGRDVDGVWAGRNHLEPTVELLRRLITLGLYSKDNSTASMSEQSFRHLAWSCPELVIPNAMEELINNLQSDRPHQVQSALETMASISIPLLTRDHFPAGSTYLENLMFGCLPGIDANDLDKSSATLKVYCCILSVVPLIEVEFSPSARQGDGDGEARAVTSMFSDWVVAVLERIFSLLNNIEKSSKSEGMNRSESRLGLLFPSFCQLFFTQMSPSIYHMALRKVRDYALGSMPMDAKKQVGILVRCCVKANPSLGLKEFFPRMKTILLEKDDSTSISHLSEMEQEWHLQMTSQMVRYTGEHLLPYVDDLLKILRITLKADEKKSSKKAAKILRHVLIALTHTYPVEFRSVSGSKWNDEKWIKTHSESWGASGDSVGVTWHCPNESEVAMASKVVAEFLEEPLKFLNETADSAQDEADKALKKKISRALATVRAVARGSCTLLPELSMDGLDVEMTDANDEDVDSDDIYPKNVPTDVGLVNSGSSHPLAKLNVRENILNMCLNMYKHCGDYRQNDVGTLSTLAKIMALLVCNRGAIENKVNYRAQVYKAMKAAFADRTHGDTRRPRFLSVERAYVAHLLRVVHRANTLVAREHPLYKSVQDALFDMSTNAYSKVRQRAQSSLEEVSRRLPLHSHKLVLRITDLLLSDPEKSERVTGAIYMLSARTNMSRLTKNWKLLSHLMLTLCNTSKHEKATVMARIGQLVFGLFMQYQNLPLAPAEPLPISTAVQQRYNKAIEGCNINRKDIRSSATASTQSIYGSLIEELLSIHESSSHWRYKVMTLSFLSLLQRPDVDPTPGIIDLVTKCMVSELAPLRMLAFKFFELHFTVHDSPQTEGEGAGFQDQNWCGWEGRNPNPMGPAGVYAELKALVPPVSDIAVNQALASAFLGKTHGDDFADRIIKCLVLSHREEGESENAASMMAALSSGGMDRLNFIPTSCSWPQTRAPRSKTDQLNMSFIRVLKHIFQGPQGCDVVKVLLPKLVAHAAAMERRTEQLVLAEFMAAIVRACSYWPKAEVDSLWKGEFGSLLLRCLTNAGNPEIVTDWATALRFSASNRDPKRPSFEYLWDVVNRSGESHSGASAAMQSKRIQYMRAVLSESGWRDIDRNKAVLHELIPQVGDGYKQVREEVGQTIAAIYFNVGGQVSSELNDRVIALLSSGTDGNNEEESSNDKMESRVAETMLTFITSSFIEGFGSSCEQHLAPLVKPISSILANPDLDLVANGRRCFALATQGPLSSPALSPILCSLEEACKDASSWRVRNGLVPIINILYLHSYFMLSEEEEKRVFKLMFSMLGDTQVEVRDLSCKILAGMLRVTSDETIQTYAKKFITWTKSSNPVEKRHGGVLGMASLVLSRPYSVPVWMPGVLYRLSSHFRDPAPISKSVKATFAEFRRSHEDMWQIHKQKFSEEELEAITELMIGPSYYA